MSTTTKTPEVLPGMLLAPTAIGQRVRSRSYGGNVRLWMCGVEGTVIRFTRSGTPVVRLDFVEYRAPGSTGVELFLVAGHALRHPPEVNDTVGCFCQITEEGKWVRS